MERAEKREVVAQLTSSFAEAGSIVVARNAGLTVADLETLRTQMKQAGGSVKVIEVKVLAADEAKRKKTAAKRAKATPGKKAAASDE